MYSVQSLTFPWSQQWSTRASRVRAHLCSLVSRLGTRNHFEQSQPASYTVRSLPTFIGATKRRRPATTNISSRNLKRLSRWKTSATTDTTREERHQRNERSLNNLAAKNVYTPYDPRYPDSTCSDVS